MLDDVITQLKEMKITGLEDDGHYCMHVTHAWCSTSVGDDCSNCVLSKETFPRFIKLLEDNKELLQTYDLITKE